QAEDGIRDFHVTGVQTCALPIWSGRGRRILSRPLRRYALGLWFCAIAALGLLQFRMRAFEGRVFDPTAVAWVWLAGSCVLACVEIGRASCRERVEVWVSGRAS